MVLCDCIQAGSMLVVVLDGPSVSFQLILRKNQPAP